MRHAKELRPMMPKIPIHKPPFLRKLPVDYFVAGLLTYYTLYTFPFYNSGISIKHDDMQSN